MGGARNSETGPALAMARLFGASSPHHHVQHGDDPEGHRDRQAHAGDGGGVAEERLEQVVEDGFPHHAETQARERDPELAGGEVGVDVVHRVADRARPRLAVAQELVDLGGP